MTDSEVVSRVEVHGLAGAHPTARRAAGRLLDLLRQHAVRATSTGLRFTDVNGPKGGQDVRCNVTVKVARRPAMSTTAIGANPRLAVDAALEKLERRLARLRETTRDSRRHPKKYFVATKGWKES
jgi:ribosome-associated translation inhibitor RaiA